jgi:hypothetical protein
MILGPFAYIVMWCNMLHGCHWVTSQTPSWYKRGTTKIYIISMFQCIMVWIENTWRHVNWTWTQDIMNEGMTNLLTFVISTCINLSSQIFPTFCFNYIKLNVYQCIILHACIKYHTICITFFSFVPKGALIVTPP